MEKETSKKPRKTSFVYVLLGENEQYKTVFTNQLKRIHGRYAWRIVKDRDTMLKETARRNNVILVADPSMNAIKDDFWEGVPAHYGKRVVSVDGFACTVSGCDLYYDWPKPANLNVKSARGNLSALPLRKRRKK